MFTQKNILSMIPELAKVWNTPKSLSVFLDSDSLANRYSTRPKVCSTCSGISDKSTLTTSSSPLPSPDFLEPAQVHLAKVIVQRAQVSTSIQGLSIFSGKTRQHFALYSHRIPACEIVTTVLHTPLLLAQLHLFAEWQTKLMELQPQLSSAVNQVICRTRFSSSILVRSSCTCSPDSRRILLPKDSGLFRRTPRRHPQLVRSVEDMMIRRLSDSFSGFPWVS